MSGLASVVLPFISGSVEKGVKKLSTELNGISNGAQRFTHFTKRATTADPSSTLRPPREIREYYVLGKYIYFHYNSILHYIVLDEIERPPFEQSADPCSMVHHGVVLHRRVSSTYFPILVNIEWYQSHLNDAYIICFN